MVSRRQLLSTIGVMALGSVGLWALQALEINTIDLPSPQQLTSPPPTETKIGETGDIADDTWLEDTTPIKNIEFYESGAAIVYPDSERDECDTHFSIVYKTDDFRFTGTRNDPSIDDTSALESWAFGDFDEPITIDLKSAIQSKSNFPSREFRMIVYPKDGVCHWERSEVFTVPEQYFDQ